MLEIATVTQLVALLALTLGLTETYEAFGNFGIIELLATDEKTDVCGPLSWKPFGEEKCFKAVHLQKQELKTFEEAISLCRKEHPQATLLTIGSREEQAFVETLFPPSTGSNIWLGATIKESNLLWQDNLTSNFSNWIYNHETPSDGTHCVELETHRTLRGKWMLANCSILNSVICQKPQIWAPSRLRGYILSMQKKLDDMERKFERRLELLDEAQEKSIPVGFVYIQLRNQRAPSAIWPNFQWLDLSSSYAGHFFRAVGGNSASFGEVQGENSPRIIRAEYKYESSSACSGSENATLTEITRLKAGFFSGWNYCSVLTLTQSEGEVRPVNSAVRVWKRTA